MILTHEFFVPDYMKNCTGSSSTIMIFLFKSMQVITTKPDKGGAIWKLETLSGPKSLKLLHQKTDKKLV